ncbi:transmembrane protein 200C-like [Petromyzon marinus]|uniref:Transmembrane protein 200C-like n=1 Tax=Petromyzon marinus TaxID=7757 RepID=A0AAJ7T375_PETMA|nr:transmembrane protein 200C-like [Petromyzon marinus]
MPAMIATGGLIRGLAAATRKQEAMRGLDPEGDPGSTRRQRRRRRRRRKRKREGRDVVLVRGRLRLVSLAGLVALLGLLVLALGIALAVLGYWPPPSPPSSADSDADPKDDAAAAAGVAAGASRENGTAARDRARGFHGVRGEKGQRGSAEELPAARSLRWLAGQMLSAERMKVVGPLVMGVGIFVFICANAVLHERRDRDTRLIRLRDLYSSAIDAAANGGAGLGPGPGPQQQQAPLATVETLKPRDDMRRARGGGGVALPGVPSSSTASSPRPPRGDPPVPSGSKAGIRGAATEGTLEMTRETRF